MKKIDLTSQKFGRLAILNDSGQRLSGGIIWNCRCDCGNLKLVSSTHLKTGHTKSCGCLRREIALRKLAVGRYRHGGGYTRICKTWHSMKRRCHDTKSIDYKWYGARGISVYLDWQNDFLSFKNWALANGYKDNLTIDRIDHNGNYEPSNCQFITQSENSIKSNRERNHEKNVRAVEVVR